jgi:hypothetical protein
MPEYVNASLTEQSELTKNAWERTMAYAFLANSDLERYGKLKSGLRDSFANGRDEFPTSLSAMRERMDVEAKNVKMHPKNDQQSDRNTRNSGNHGNRNQDKEKQDEENTFTSFAQLSKGKFYCYCCGSPEHKCDKCPEKDKPKEKWFKNMMENHMQAEIKNSKEGQKNSKSSKSDE